MAPVSGWDWSWKLTCESRNWQHTCISFTVRLNTIMLNHRRFSWSGVVLAALPVVRLSLIIMYLCCQRSVFNDLSIGRSRRPNCLSARATSMPITTTAPETGAESQCPPLSLCLHRRLSPLAGKWLISMYGNILIILYYNFQIWHLNVARFEVKNGRRLKYSSIFKLMTWCLLILSEPDTDRWREMDFIYAAIRTCRSSSS